MVHDRTMQGAHRRCAPFFILLLCLFTYPAQAQDIALPERCQVPTRDHGSARVEFVYDGDTVRLQDGRRVRLISLDTPEFNHRNDALEPEPFAEEARQALTELLAAHGNRVRLVHDREREDRYQRSLAHLFTPDGQSITALMLARGLGMRLTIPPNDWNIDCYQDAERFAGNAELGIWSLGQNRLFEAADLPRDSDGFRRVEGRITRIGESRRAIWINLEGDVALRIDRQDLGYFPDLSVEQLQQLVGMQVRGRGYVYTHRGQLRIRLRHAADLTLPVIDTATPLVKPDTVTEP
ncbi:MAG: thermonuclease family protein [Thioalkalivibrio sp.]